jgi:hypothetical protein
MLPLTIRAVPPLSTGWSCPLTTSNPERYTSCKQPLKTEAMKTAFKLTDYSTGMAASPAAFFNSLAEAENAIPAGYAYMGDTLPDDRAPELEITEFTYPDPIADMQMAWQQGEIVKDSYYFKE